MCEEARIAGEGMLPRAGAAEFPVHRAGRREREHHPHENRDQPVGPLRETSHLERQPDPYRRGQPDHGHPQEAHSRRPERRWPFGPLEERLEFSATHVGTQAPVRRKLFAPLGGRRELACAPLTALDHIGSGRAEQPGLQRFVTGCSRRRTEPLHQRRPPEQVQVDSVRMARDRRHVRPREQGPALPPRRRLRWRQPIPRTRDPGQSVQIDDVERVVPVGALVHPRVPDHEAGKQGQEPAREDHQGPWSPVGDRPDENGGAWNERRQPEARDHDGQSSSLIPASSMGGCSRFVVLAHAAARRPPMLSL